MRRLTIGLVMFTAAACSSSAKTVATTTAPVTHTITGSVAFGSPYEGGSDGCDGRDGHDDLTPGAVVAVTDQAGVTIATGTLAEGHASSTKVCTMPLSVSGVPDAKFYGVEVTHRGAVKFSREDLAAKGWKVTLTVG